MLNMPVWDETQNDKMNASLLKVTELRKKWLWNCFNYLWLPKLEKRYPEWSIGSAFEVKLLKIK